MGRAHVLVLTQDQVLIESLRKEFPTKENDKIGMDVAPNTFEAGLLAGVLHPDCVVIDFSIGTIEAFHLCKCLKGNAVFTQTILCALTPEDGTIRGLDVNETFQKPFDPHLLAERLRTLVGVKKELT